MKICEQCQQSYPDDANYCINCGKLLSVAKSRPGEDSLKGGNWQLFWLTKR